ncbi:prostaglandin E synthase 2-like isoform X2 [Ruditapes philippinarum]|uniref:prostaglandin E synthase 2-like isoform X2 n=1 Tax=Ruditapes philippinarum TaxID=129788 RepID=UPI00295AF5F3|nr:prostaglandin E synthase 2-like isoform X2 [Ruditapes philippinarum]
MAAPLRRTTIGLKNGFAKNLLKSNNESRSPAFSCKNILTRNFSNKFNSCRFASLKKNWKIGACMTAATSVFATSYFRSRRSFADVEPRPISRHVPGVVDIGNQKFTLYQFQSCPYCCKARAALDYFGFTYDVVEVNSITKSQMKFSEYKKVPVLVVDGQIGDKDFTLQFNDSSTIVSVLASYVYDQNTPLYKLHQCYPGIKEKEGRKTVWDFPNKYFIMYGENIADSRTETQRRDERKWRRWTDDILMHTISPNVYRTLPESLEAFHHFSEWGEWDKNFSTGTRLGIVYVGAFVMYFIGKLVKRRHDIKDNPRESLYDACDEWMKAVGKKQFYGGDKPNLADLSVYGALHSFEGCLAHKDLMEFHRIEKWYKRMEQQINGHEGAHLLKVAPSKHPNLQL